MTRKRTGLGAADARLQPARDLDRVVVLLFGSYPRVAASLRRVRANDLERVEIGAAHVAGHVLAGEARRIEAVDIGLLVIDGVDEIFEILVDEPIGADLALHLL